jgi:hypothetical protein
MILGGYHLESGSSLDSSSAVYRITNRREFGVLMLGRLALSRAEAAH